MQKLVEKFPEGYEGYLKKEKTEPEIAETPTLDSYLRFTRFVYGDEDREAEELVQEPKPEQPKPERLQLSVCASWSQSLLRRFMSAQSYLSSALSREMAIAMLLTGSVAVVAVGVHWRYRR